MRIKVKRQEPSGDKTLRNRKHSITHRSACALPLPFSDPKTIPEPPQFLQTWRAFQCLAPSVFSRMPLPWCLERASGRLENRIENLLGLEGHPAPRFIGAGASEQFVEGVEHVDLLAR